MESITLTSHQQEAVAWLVTRLSAGEKLVALRGYAGTGKTSLIPALQAALRTHDLPSVIGAPTHRAAMILRKKGLDADTLHSTATVPYFRADYRRACAWLGEDLPAWEGAPEAEARPDIDGLPWLVYEAVQPDLERGRALKRQRRYTARQRLDSLAISGKDHFLRFGPRAGQGVLIIDEASMVGKALLAICQEAYQQIVLVGDPGQLPPVKDTAVLGQVEGVDLTEIHRQAQDSPILQLAYQARAGEPFWEHLDRDPLSVGKPVRAVDEVSARRFLTCPLLVGFNETRLFATHAIREALGYAKAVLYPGEPLVCRSKTPEDRVLGFFNNGLYTITAVSPHDPRLITVKDALGDVQTIWAHLEEVDGLSIDPRAIPFRFGYAFTVHTAQGGEWPRVYISLPDLHEKVRKARRYNTQEELTQWAYTAITRARTHVRFLTQHMFTSPKERTAMPVPKRDPEAQAPLKDEEPRLLPPAPSVEERLAATPTSMAEAAIFGDDDLADPAVPPALREALEATTMPQDATQTGGRSTDASATESLSTAPAERFGEHEAILQAFCAHFLKRFDAGVHDAVMELNRPVNEIYAYVADQLQIQREKTLQAETYLNTLAARATEQGIQLRSDPYSVQIQALSPQGFPVSFTLVKQDMEALAEETGVLMHRLAQGGYKPVGLGL